MLHTFYLNKECERCIITLLLSDVLHPHIVFNAYNTICYIKLGPNGQKMLASQDPHVNVDFPIRQTRTSAASKKSPKAVVSVADNDGWISTKKQKAGGKDTMKAKSSTKKRKSTSSKVIAKKRSEKTKRGKAAPKKTAMKSEVVEIDSSESSDDDFLIARKSAAKKRRRPHVIDDSSIDES